jgi:DNA-binding response OmpR family regulator
MGGAPLSVLLVDDERDFVSALAMRLQLRGFHAVAVFEGEAGLAMLAREGFDAVLLDMRLPDLSGLEVLRRIRAQRPGLPVILLTGHAGAEEEAVSEGAAACLTKPLELEDLLIILKGLRGGNA